MPTELGANALLRLAVVITSNAYEDRSQETIRQAALEKYVDSCWKGDEFVADDPLLFWHGGDPIGQIVFSDTEGPFLLEVAREASNGEVNLADEGEPPALVSVKEFWDRLANEPEEWGASHEFIFFEPDAKDKVYDTILKTESSVLPRQDAANAFTFFSVLSEEDSHGRQQTS